MERAQGFIVPPRFLQRNVGGDDLDDIEAILDLVNHAHNSTPQAYCTHLWYSGKWGK
jgi:hypothetical protein